MIVFSRFLGKLVGARSKAIGRSYAHESVTGVK